MGNYKFIGNKLVVGILEKLQNPIIINSIPVSAGKVLSEQYRKIKEVYPYFSTTHTSINRVDKNLLTINFLFVGRLENLKRIDDAIHALGILYNNNITNFHFHIVGDGKEKERLKTLAQEQGILDFITFHGYISQSNQIEELYKKSNIFLFPSISEGTPKVLAEAMSFGTIPIAVKTTGSIPYIIEDKKNGFLVNAQSPKEIAESIEELLNDEKLYTQMIENCYEYAQEHTLQKEVEKMWNYIFHELD